MRTRKLPSRVIKQSFLDNRSGPKIFDNGWDVFPLFVVAIGKTRLTEKDFHAVLANNGNATSLLVTDKEIHKIEKGDDVLRARYKGFDIFFLLAEKPREEGILDNKEARHSSQA